MPAQQHYVSAPKMEAMEHLSHNAQLHSNLDKSKYFYFFIFILVIHLLTSFLKFIILFLNFVGSLVIRIMTLF